MSLAIVYTRARLGIQAPLVTVEVHLSNGLPGLSIVGLPETAVKESKDRVRSAIINSHFDFPARRITINLAPADLPKEGSRFDLAIAVGILAASDQIPKAALEKTEFIAELALSGDLRPVTGILPAAMSVNPGRTLVVASQNAQEAALYEEIPIYHGQNLLSVCAHLHQQAPLSRAVFTPPSLPESEIDLADVQGQLMAKRALEIAAAGGHNLLLYGPPGTGKTLLASRLPTILPPLNRQQSIEVISIHSLTGASLEYWQTPPFRHPHHTASAVSLVGGGSYPKPGEISLAHNGVLFLDELPEFQRQVLEVLREPLESGEIRISRANAQVTFPANFQLVAAMNPCPCGYLSTPATSSNNNTYTRHSCRCSQEQVQRYRQKISGPLLDRIDLHIPVAPVPMEDISTNKRTQKTVENSAQVRLRVERALSIQQGRQGKKNASLSGKELANFAALGEGEEALLQQALIKLGLSARAYHRVIRVARTIADLAGAESILSHHLSEALSLRQFDRG